MTKRGGMLTTAEVARVKGGVSISTVSLAVKEGKLHPVQDGPGAVRLFREAEVTAWEVTPRVKRNGDGGEANGHVNGSAPKATKHEDELSVVLDQIEGFVARARTLIAKREAEYDARLAKDRVQIESKVRRDLEKEAVAVTREAMKKLRNGSRSLPEG